MAHRCAGELKKKFDLQSGSKRHRHFAGFFNVPLQALTLVQPFYGYSEKPPHSVAFYDTHGDTEVTFSTSPTESPLGNLWSLMYISKLDYTFHNDTIVQVCDIRPRDLLLSLINPLKILFIS